MKQRKGSDLCSLGYKATDLHLRAIEKELGRIINGMDIGAVHQARVHARWLRSTMPVFRVCMDKEHYGLLRQELGLLLKNLGKARDLDVYTAFLADLLEQEPSAYRAQPSGYPGLEQYIGALEEQRQEIQPGVIRSAERFGEFLDQNRKDLMKAFRMPRKQPSITRKSEIAVCKWLTVLLANEVPHGIQEKEKLHMMRISAKKTRYNIEFFWKADERISKEHIRILKNVQDLLGQIHDYEVWQALASDFLKQLNDKGNDGRGAVESISRLIAELERREEETRRSFNRSWTADLEPALIALAESFGDVCAGTVPAK